jgi:pimeloyl-ACP methyl ester carboxylesterase
MLPVFEFGNPYNPPIVFIHGGGLSHKAWIPVIERLPEFYSLAVDLPEHGSSRNIPFNMADASSAIIEMVQQRLTGRKVYLVGHSLGGAVALTILGTSPDIIENSIISGSSGRLPNWIVRLSIPFLGLARFVKFDALTNAGLDQHGIQRIYHDLVFEDSKNSMNEPLLRHIYESLANFEPPKDVQQQLLVCVGEYEPSEMGIGALQIARRYLKLYPSAQGVIMPGAKHAWLLQYPDDFAEMVRAWVTGKPLPPILKPIQI